MTGIRGRRSRAPYDPDHRRSPQATVDDHRTHPPWTDNPCRVSARQAARPCRRAFIGRADWCSTRSPRRRPAFTISMRARTANAIQPASSWAVSAVPEPSWSKRMIDVNRVGKLVRHRRENISRKVHPALLKVARTRRSDTPCCWASSLTGGRLAGPGAGVRQLRGHASGPDRRARRPTPNPGPNRHRHHFSDVGLRRPPLAPNME